MNKTGIIILAAGNSSRLGRPKQLLPYRGKTLLAHTATEALNAALHPVIVVTGAYHAEVSDSLRGQPVDIMYNPAWETGMASGIVTGVTGMLSLRADADAMIIAVCDQPFISAALLSALVSAHAASGKGIIACGYADTAGTPVLFSSRYFEELLKLSGSEGAKKLLKRYPADVGTIPFPEGEVDIDTEEDVHGMY